MGKNKSGGGEDKMGGGEDKRGGSVTCSVTDNQAPFFIRFPILGWEPSFFVNEIVKKDRTWLFTTVGQIPC